MNTKQITKQEAWSLVSDTLQLYQTSKENAQKVADALVSAEIDLQIGHGLSRVPSYVVQLLSNKVDGMVTPSVISIEGGVVKIDANHGFAFPAMSLAVKELKNMIQQQGIAIATVSRSHHAGQSGYHVEKLANAGLIGLMFCNSPKAIAPWGGNKPLFGTNPIAFAAPRKENEPLVIDLSLSKVARGKIINADLNNQEIPEGWAINAKGEPTNSAKDALAGSMLPIGGAKGCALVLMIEILVAGLAETNFGFEASSFFDEEGGPPNIGQVLIAIDPKKFNNNFASRLEIIIKATLEQSERLPGETRLSSREKTKTQGINISQKLYDEIVKLKGLI